MKQGNAILIRARSAWKFLHNLVPGAHQIALGRSPLAYQEAAVRQVVGES